MSSDIICRAQLETTEFVALTADGHTGTDDERRLFLHVGTKEGGNRNPYIQLNVKTPAAFSLEQFM